MRHCSYCRAPISGSERRYELKRHEYERQALVLTLCDKCGREVESLAQKRDCMRCRAPSCNGCPVADERRTALASAG